MQVIAALGAKPIFPQNFVPFAGTPEDCVDCGKAERVGFDFDYAYQPIVDVDSKTVFAHEALVRGPKGEGAATVLSQVNDHNRYRFDQACRVKAIKGAAELGLTQPVSINFLPNAIYKPEVCIRTTLEAARAHGFPLSQIIFEVTEGERIETPAERDFLFDVGIRLMQGYLFAKPAFRAAATVDAVALDVRSR